MSRQVGDAGRGSCDVPFIDIPNGRDVSLYMNLMINLESGFTKDVKRRGGFRCRQTKDFAIRYNSEQLEKNVQWG